MIEPGKITIDLLIGDPLTVLLLLLASTAFLGATSGLLADKIDTERKKAKIKSENPEADISQMYDSLNDWISVAMGILSVVVIVWPLMDTIDMAAGFFGILASSILVGFGSRQLLPFLSDRLVSQVKEEK